MVIWKWTLKVKNYQIIEVPEGSTFIDVQVQSGIPCIWAICDEKASRETRAISMFQTGELIEAENGFELGIRYISTFQKGDLIFHVFQDK